MGCLLHFVCLFAFIANLAMLVFLVFKQAAMKTVHIFICNQTVLDLVITFFAAVKIDLIDCQDT